MRVILFFFLLGLTTNPIVAQQSHQKFIEVFGLGEKEILADFLEMSVSVKENDNLKRDSDFAQKEKLVLDAIKKLGIAQEDITVDNFNAYRFGLNSSSNRYSLSKTFLVKVRELKSIDEFIIKLYEAGASQVQITKRVKTDLEKHKTEAVKAAVESAKQRAAEIATTLEVELGKAIQVIEIREGELNSFQSRFDNPYAYKKYDLSATGAVHRGYDDSESETLPNVDIRKMKINYKVLIQFEILAK